MFITKKHLSRRTFLRGASGVAVALPLLDAMIPALTAQSKTAAAPQMRFGAVYFPQGSVSLPTAPIELWHPAGTGEAFEFTPVLKPFEPFREQITVLSGLSRTGSSGSHLLASSMWLNAVPPLSRETSSFKQDTTIDQRIAAKIGQDTPFPSFELGIDDFAGNSGGAATCGGEGFSCLYWSTISWRNPTTPLPLENNPRVLFERIFGSPGTVAQRLARLENHRSILDDFVQDSTKLKGALGARDRVRLDQYMENIREVERRIQNTAAKTHLQTEGAAYMPDAPAGIPDSYDEHVKLQFDIQALAFQGDMTRVFTMMMLHEGQDLAYPACGVLDGDHSLSHHGNVPGNMARRALVNTYHNELMAYFLDKLKKTPDGDGTLLDHTMVLYGSGMGNGNVHDHTNLPLIVAGAKTFGVKGNRRVLYTKETPMANLLVGLVNKAGLNVDKIADSTGSVDL